MQLSINSYAAVLGRFLERIGQAPAKLLRAIKLLSGRVKPLLG
jgi:hypothetical protein